MQIQELADKGLLRREDGRRRDEHHHHLAALKAPSHQHMAQKAAARALVKHLDLEVPEHTADIGDDAVRDLILDEAVVHRDYPVGARLIHAGDDAIFLIQGKGRADLVAVMGGVCHAEDRLHMPEGAEEGDLPRLLAPELFRIGQVLELAAAAFFIQRTGRAVALFHGVTPRFLRMGTFYHTFLALKRKRCLHESPSDRRGGACPSRRYKEQFKSKVRRNRTIPRNCRTYFSL